ncbi:MAG: hypothetical protein JWO86_6624 [Myxococcaceae bacterium]|nr:hypothetical protein [Myxococcaceae bacterium]MEA2746493.1 hypothetical protein [Myxococcales bacterium]
MTGIARSLVSFLFVPLSIAGCGAPVNEAAASPKASAPDSHVPPPAMPPAASGSGSGSASTTAAPATPSDGSVWPFAPAPSADELAAQADRLAKDQGPIKTNWTPPGKSDRYGHAEGLIAAPYDAVKARLLDFPRYKELAGPKFKKVSVVDKTANGTDLYFQLPIMKGLVTIWYVTRFSTARPGMAGAEVVEGKFVKGNIKDMQIAFTIRPTADQKTILVCDLNLAISLPAPQSALDEELRDACGDAVNAIRARSTQP